MRTPDVIAVPENLLTLLQEEPSHRKDAACALLIFELVHRIASLEEELLEALGGRTIQ